jgi:serine/threonine protein kinase
MLKDLKDKGRSFNQDDALAVLKQIASVLCTLHKQGIVHRNICWEKIMIVNEQDLIVKLSNSVVSRTINGCGDYTPRVGKANYWAPEIEQGIYDYKVDVFSLGVVLYEMMTGSKPSEVQDMRSVLQQIQKYDGVTIDLILAMLNPNANQRPSAAEIVARFQ